MSRAFGEIYCQDESTPQTTDATPGAFDVITGFNANSGLAQNMTEDSANNKLTSVIAGIYFVIFQVSFSGSNTFTYTLHLYVNGVSQNATGCHRKLGSVDVGSASFTGLVSVGAGVDIDVRVACDGASKTFTPEDMQLSVYRVGPTS